MTAPKPLPSQDRLRELFDYDPIAGTLTWRRRDDIDPGFNGRFAGKKAGALSGRGWSVMVDHRGLRYHRVIWKMIYGTEPPEIDHINGNVSDNRLVNLRASSRLLNGKNRAPNKNKTLPKGVTLGRNCVNYAAHIVFNGVRENLGRFATPEDAHQAYLEAAEARFGEWARAGERREFSRIKKTRGPPSEESRAKISATLTGRKLPPFTEAHRAALSASLKGQKRGPLSEEHRALLSKIKTGKKRPPMSDEWRAAIGAAQLGKKRGPPSPETRMKRRVSMLAYFQRKADADIAPGES
jgi:hypothetical protein